MGEGVAAVVEVERIGAGHGGVRGAECTENGRGDAATVGVLVAAGQAKLRREKVGSRSCDCACWCADDEERLAKDRERRSTEGPEKARGPKSRPTNIARSEAAFAEDGGRREGEYSESQKIEEEARRAAQPVS